MKGPKWKLSQAIIERRWRDPNQFSASLLKIDPINTFNKSEDAQKQILFSIPNVYNELIVKTHKSIYKTQWEPGDGSVCVGAPHGELTFNKRLFDELYLLLCYKIFVSKLVWLVM